MKNFREILKTERSTQHLTRRRDERNQVGRLTKAQRDVQALSEYQLNHFVSTWHFYDQQVAVGILHPLQHPYAAIIARVEREQLLQPHPSTRAHPLARL